MKNKNVFSNSSSYKRYYTLDYYYKNKFGGKVFKVPINAGFTCPNIDGTKGYGGCTFCSSKGSGDFISNNNDLVNQFEDMKNILSNKWKNAKYVAYFQSFTNTYAEIKELKEKYELFLNYKDIVGINIATRPDCLSNDIVDYLEYLSKKIYLVVELGLQTIHDKTGNYINRCHSYNDFLVGYNKLKSRNINICVHIINGLPFETHNMMLKTVSELSKLDLFSIKIHLLYILKNTIIAYQYSKGIFKCLNLDQYVNIVCDQLELLSSDTIIERVTGDGLSSNLIAPLWSLKKFVVINEIDKELKRRNSYQGIYYDKSGLIK